MNMFYLRLMEFTEMKELIFTVVNRPINRRQNTACGFS